MNGEMMLNDYNALFIFDQSLDEEGIKRVLAGVGEEISRLNGVVTGTEMCGKRTFARTMKKREAGCYVRLTIQLAPDCIQRLLERLKLNEDVFRVQVIKQEPTKAAAVAAGTPAADAPVAAEESDAESQ